MAPSNCGVCHDVTKLHLPLFLLLLPAYAADLAFVFGEETPSLSGLRPQELQELAASAPELEGGPQISEVPEDEIMEFTEVGGKTLANSGTKSTAGPFLLSDQPDGQTLATGSYDGTIRLKRVA